MVKMSVQVLMWLELENNRDTDKLMLLCTPCWGCQVHLHMTKERATYLCMNSRTVDSHCAVSPFLGMPPLVSSTGQTASRSCQATTNSWLVSIFQRAVVLNCHFVRKQRKADYSRRFVPFLCTYIRTYMGFMCVRLLSPFPLCRCWWHWTTCTHGVTSFTLT